MSLKICHIAPFAPYRCGLYEACRDMIKSDIDMGLDVIFVDAGVTENGELQQGKIGEIDERYNFKLVTSDPNEIDNCDLVVCHTGFPDSWIVKNQLPLVWVIHGRPRACYIPEFNGKGNSYTLVQNVASWNRTKAVVHFWEEFRDYWKFSIPSEKHKIISTPCIDIDRFSQQENLYEIQEKGEVNVLIAESHREDVDIYETIMQCLNNVHLGVKYHFFALEKFDSPLHQFLFSKLKETGCLGDAHARMSNMELVYPSMDILLSPQKIITRSVIEAYVSGLLVVGQLGNKLAHNTIDFFDPLALKKEWYNLRRYDGGHEIISQLNYKKEIMEVYLNAVKK